MHTYPMVKKKGGDFAWANFKDKTKENQTGNVMLRFGQESFAKR